MPLFRLSVPGSRTLQIRCAGYIPVLAVLGLIFIIPHDPHTRLSPDKIGGDAMRIAWQNQAPRLHGSSPAVPFAHRQSLTASGGLEANSTAMGLFTSVEALRRTYGTGRDLTPRQTRELYHSLLPTWLLEDGHAAAQAYSLPDRAQLAIAARQAAKLYARERAVLPAAISSQLFDGLRRLIVGGSFQPGGLSTEEIWLKYAGVVPDDGETLPNDVYYTILRKACTSNPQIDALCGAVGGAAQAAGAAAEAVSMAA